MTTIFSPHLVKKMAPASYTIETFFIHFKQQYKKNTNYCRHEKTTLLKKIKNTSQTKSQLENFKLNFRLQGNLKICKFKKNENISKNSLFCINFILV